MKVYRVVIQTNQLSSFKARDLGEWETVRNFTAMNSREAVNFLRAQIKWLLAEPYEVARFEGEEPLPGLEGFDEHLERDHQRDRL